MLLLAPCLQMCMVVVGTFFLFMRHASLRVTLNDLWQSRTLAEEAEKWRLWRDFFVALLICAAISLAFFMIGSCAQPPAGETDFFAYFIMQTAQVFALGLLWRYNRTQRPSAIFCADGQAVAKAAVVAYVMFFPVLMALVWACILCVPPAAAYVGFEVRMEQPTLKRFLSEPAQTADRLAFVLTAVITAPLLEEILLRGYLFSALRRHLSWLTSAALNGAIFALLHQDAVRFFPLMALGMFFCGMRERKRTLAAPIVCHTLHNGLTLFFAVLGAKG